MPSSWRWDWADSLVPLAGAETGVRAIGGLTGDPEWLSLGWIQKDERTVSTQDCGEREKASKS